MEVLSTGLDIWLEGRRGPSGTFPPERLAQIRRTVGGAPEVFVMASSGGTTRAAVKSDIAYMGHGGAEIETDRGEILSGPRAAETVVDRWDIDLARGLGKWRQSVSITLSMPEGTPAAAVLAASREFAKQHFSNHPYVLALHQDKPNNHVHLVVKSEGRNGKRLNINRETLRDYRLSFAQLMRAQGIDANATLNAARGKFREPKEGRAIGFLARAGKSAVVKAKAVDALREVASGTTSAEPVKGKLLHIRHDVLIAWAGVMRQLQAEGHTKLAADVGRFVSRFEPVRTEREKLKEKAIEQLRDRIKENRALDANRDAPTR